MIRRASTEVAILGAGVVGLAIAERLLSEGREVMLVDPGRPGMGCSSGNAGTVADYAVAPVGTPEVLRNLPSLLFDRMSPLAIQRAALPSLAPWLLRFARQSLPGAAERNAKGIAAMLQDAGPMWRELAVRIGGEAILRHRGCLYLYRTEAAFRAAGAEMAKRRALGVTVDLLAGAAAACRPCPGGAGTVLKRRRPRQVLPRAPGMSGGGRHSVAWISAPPFTAP